MIKSVATYPVNEPVFVMLSLDLKQKASTEVRSAFDEKLSASGWQKLDNIDTAWTKLFEKSINVSQSVAIDVCNALLTANGAEVVYAFQCGNAEVVQKTFLNPKLNQLTQEKSYVIAP